MLSTMWRVGLRLGVGMPQAMNKNGFLLGTRMFVCENFCLGTKR